MEESFHSFLETTIDYNANRLDFWIQKANCLVKGAPLRLSIPESLASEPERPCLLGCCTALEGTIPAMVKSLLLKTRHWGVSRLDAIQASTERRKIVALSSNTIDSSESIRIQLRSLVPSVNPSKVFVWWKLLARPITILRNLSAITKLLPNFRTVRFIPLKVPTPIKLRTDQVPKIAEAWQSLGLFPSSNGSIPASVTRKARDFQDNCSRELAVHCEIQLIVRYEKEPSLAPTLAYFGCSKKACFLCDSFLTLSLLKPRVRGRHGVCHPNWAVPLESTESITTSDRLTELCSIIKEQIVSLLQPGYCLAPNIIHQSSAVSELKTADMAYLSQMTANREAVEEVAKEYRERMQTL
jgi:hypothetical protein